MEIALRNCDNKKHFICLSDIGIDILTCGITSAYLSFYMPFFGFDAFCKLGLIGSFLCDFRKFPQERALWRNYMYVCRFPLGSQ